MTDHRITRLLASAASLAAACLATGLHAQTQTTSSWTDTIVVTGARGNYAQPDSDAATRTDTPVIQIPQSVPCVLFDADHTGGVPGTGDPSDMA